MTRNGLHRGAYGLWSRPLLAAVLGGILVLLCVATRMPWSGGSGYIGDMRSFHLWAAAGSRLRGIVGHGAPGGAKGLGLIYRVRRDCNYPPFYVEVLSFLPGLHSWWYGEPAWKGRVQRITIHKLKQPLPWSIARVLKLPAIIASVGIALLVFAWAWRLTSPARAFLIGAFWALNPFGIFDGSYFGQVDSIHSLWMLAALLAAVERRLVWAWSLLTLALLTKPQAVVLVPIVVLETLRPFVAALRRGDRAALSGTLRTWLGAALAAGVTACVILWPFLRAGTLGDVTNVYTGAISETTNALTTVTANNLWWLMLDPPVRRVDLPPDDEEIGDLVTAREIGLFLLGAATLAALWLCARGNSRQTTFLATVVIAFAFFLLPTQMKARYCFPVLVLLLPLFAFGARYVVAAAVVTLTFLMNGMQVLSLDESLAFFVPALNSAADAMWTGHIVALINFIVFAWLCFDLYKVAVRQGPDVCE